MTSPNVPHLIMLAGLLGIHGEIITVSKVQVKTGGSISIPCLYEHQYRDHVKYLCEGQYFFSCTIVVKTNQLQSSSSPYSIYDDTNQTIFSVSINDLKKDTRYWCAVEIIGRGDVHQRFELSVTTGMSSLFVHQQEITAFEGGSVTVRCHYKYPEVMKWCRLGSDCVTNQSRLEDGARVTISTSVPNEFSVTMSELRKESSGWYWCAKGELQMPVHITVELTSTTTTAVSTNIANFMGTHTTTHQYSSLLTSTEPHPANATVTVAGGESLRKSSTKVTILITVLVLLLLAVPVACFGWRMMRRNKSKPEGPDVTAGSQTGSDPEVLYATVVYNQHAAAQKEQDHIPEAHVTYSAILIKDKRQQMVEANDGSAIYSNLA